MVSKLAREVRCTDVLRRFAEDNDGMCFLTLTTPDVVTILQIRERWRNLRHDLVRRLGRDAKYVMNYELHPRGHGWHIHAVFNRYIPLRRGGLYRLRSFGFRMIRVEKVTTEGVALYLSKHCLKAYRGVSKQLQGQSKRLRLVNCSRGLPVLSDYKWKSRFVASVRERLQNGNFLSTFKKFPFSLRYRYAEYSVLMGWSVRRLCLELSKREGEAVV